MIESFLRLIENDFNQFRRYIIKNKLFENIKIKISNIILYSPNPNNSFIQLFEDVYSYQSENYTKILNELYSQLKIDKSSLWYTDEPINEEILGIIEDSLRQNKNVMYLHKHGKHLTNLVNKVRNSLAHGNFYILNKRMVMWNISPKKNVTFFIHFGLKDFKYFHDTLMSLILES